MHLTRIHSPRSRARAVSAVVGVLALASLLGACDLALSNFKEEATDHWSKKFPLSATGKLEISNTNGRISVQAGSGNEVEVEAVLRARGATKESAAEMLKQIEIREEASADRVKLETKAPRMRGGSANVEYTVRVPVGATVNLSNVNGPVEISGTTGPVQATTTNGPVEGHQLSGPVKATTTNGKIEVELTTLSGDVTLGTTNGPVSLKLPSSSKADLDLQLTNGAIDLEGFTLDGEKDRRRVRGRINGGGARIQAETVNGPIQVSGR